MQVGFQFVANEGFGQLAKGECIHFLKSDTKKQRVLLILFQGVGKNKPRAHLIIFHKRDFESALLARKIVPSIKQSTLPPWLEPLSGIDLSQIDQFRPNAKHAHTDRVEKRLCLIGVAIKNYESILAADDPERELNSYARACNPPQHEMRFRIWFLTYLCFGRNPWVLIPPFHRSGRWNRLNHSNKKFGRHSIAHGAGYGHGMDQAMIDKILTGYLRYSGLGVKMTNVYQNTMRNIFGCKTIRSTNGMMRFFHPKNLRFPTHRQFSYRVLKTYGLEYVQKTLYGAVRHRARLAASKGRFSEGVANLMEKVEADGYYTEERPKGYVEGSTLPAMCCVTGRDPLCGLLLGIGFSLGKEKSSAYRMMLFSMAVPKDFFGKLFGIKISNEDWPSQGLPPFITVDRGPGAKRDLIIEIEERFPVREIAPSWSGQSKATVESSHPRDTHIEGQPTHIHSNLRPVELAVREIYRLLSFNHTANMESRIQPDDEMALIQPTPIGIWNFYEERCRTDAQPMSIDDAVRTFLTPVMVVVKNDGVWLGSQKYDSTELRATGILDDVARSASTRIKAYVLDICVRHIWVEIDRRIIMLNAMLRIRDDDEKLYVSMAELEQWTEARKKIMSEFREHQHAASSEFKGRFEDATGKPYDSGCRKPGKPPVDATSRQEEKEAKEFAEKKRKRE